MTGLRRNPSEPICAEVPLSSTSTDGAPSLWKGLVAGLIAGVAATAAKTIAEKFYPPRIHGEPEPPEVLSERIAGHPLDDSTRFVASESIHWGFGAAAGAFYGALAEFYPAVTSKEGANFGLTLMALTHTSALPAMGLSAPTEQQSEREQTSEAATHLIYGVVAERVRSIVRNMLD
jgi:putative membrane protein